MPHFSLTRSRTGRALPLAGMNLADASCGMFVRAGSVGPCDTAGFRDFRRQTPLLRPHSPFRNALHALEDVAAAAGDDILGQRLIRRNLFTRGQRRGTVEVDE